MTEWRHGLEVVQTRQDLVRGCVLVALRGKVVEALRSTRKGHDRYVATARRKKVASIPVEWRK